MPLCEHGVLLSKRCPQCAIREKRNQPELKPEQQVGCWVRVILKDGMGHIDIAQPPGFQFLHWVAIVKGGGGVLTNEVHVPWENISFAMVIPDPSVPTRQDHFTVPLGKMEIN
jgi:hypothetical protein